MQLWRSVFAGGLAGSPSVLQLVLLHTEVVSVGPGRACLHVQGSEASSQRPGHIDADLVLVAGGHLLDF